MRSQVPRAAARLGLGHRATARCTHGQIFAIRAASTVQHPTCAFSDQVEVRFPGTHREQVYSATPSFVDPEDLPAFPIFRTIDEDGFLVQGAALDDTIDRELAIRMYSRMVKVQEMDRIFFEAQRQGRITFYMENKGEESAHIGSAAALDARDMIFAQYREVGVLLWRGFTIQDCADQCFSNSGDTGKGRQLPVHYGSSRLNFQTISSPLATQIPQAAGAAYSLKVEQKRQGLEKSDSIVVCYFGEGAASEGDFHPAMNFAATLEVPVVFFCRNNGFAISTSVKDQFSNRADGVAARGPGYGIRTVRVDGNDVLAVYQCMREAREYARTHSRPVLVEAMSYRQGHHSTSDDSTSYRTIQEMKEWFERCPVVRFRKFLEHADWWNDELEGQLRDKEKQVVLDALREAEKKPKCPLTDLFTDVYSEMPDHLRTQSDELQVHIAKYPSEYS